MKKLPPSRPFDDPTNILFYLAKAPLVDAFIEIAGHLQDVRVDHETLKQLDSGLRSARDMVPDYYRVRSIGGSLIDPGYIVMRRYAVDQIYLTGMCILHRKGLVLSKFDERFIHSRKACLEAAITVLEYQRVRYQETKPAGRLSGLEGMILSITKNDYLLAAMLICLDLHLSTAYPESPSTDDRIWGRSRSDELLRALECSYYIWKEDSEKSVDALKASEALAAMLVKVRPEFGITTKYTPSPQHTETFNSYIHSGRFSSFCVCLEQYSSSGKLRQILLFCTETEIRRLLSPIAFPFRRCS